MIVKCVEYPSSSEIPRAIPSCKSTISSSSGLLAQTSRRDRVLDGFPSFECLSINEQIKKTPTDVPTSFACYLALAFVPCMPREVATVTALFRRSDLI